MKIFLKKLCSFLTYKREDVSILASQKYGKNKIKDIPEQSVLSQRKYGKY